MTSTKLSDAKLAARVTAALTAIAETVTEHEATPDGPAAPPLQGPTTPRGRSRRASRAAALTVLAAATLSVAAAAYVRVGPEFVDKLPPKDVMQQGTVDGDTYFMVPSFHTDICGRPMPGVEIVTASRNAVGGEWDTSGMSYGGKDPVDGCVPPADPAAPTDTEPTRYDLGFSRAGADEDRAWLGAIGVHPQVTELDVTVPGYPARSLATVPIPSQPAGPRYAVIALPLNSRDFVLVLRDRNGRQVARYDETLPTMTP